MIFHTKYPTLLSATVLIAGSLMVGCAAKKKPEPPPAPVATAAPDTAEKPNVTESRTDVVTARVQALNKKKRTVTLAFPDGRTQKIKAGPEIRNFDQIQVGDDVTAAFKETVEIKVVSGQGVTPDAIASEATERAPKGSKPAGAIIKTAEISAIVESIDYDTRKVVLRGPEGKTTTVTAGPEVKRLKAVKPGDAVIARFTEALAIEVTSPANTPKK